MEVLHSIGAAYGTRPSALLGVKDEFQAFSVDYWALCWGRQEEVRLIRAAERKAKHGRR